MKYTITFRTDAGGYFKADGELIYEALCKLALRLKGKVPNQEFELFLQNLHTLEIMMEGHDGEFEDHPLRWEKPDE